MREICSELTTKTLERCHWRRSLDSIVNFEKTSTISHVFIIDFEQVNGSWENSIYKKYQKRFKVTSSMVPKKKTLYSLTDQYSKYLRIYQSVFKIFLNMKKPTGRKGEKRDIKW